MISTYFASIVYCWLLLLGSGATHEANQGQSPPPSSLFGTWNVEHVAVDPNDQMHWEFRPDDPWLMGRQIIIEAGQISSDIREVNCKQTVWKRGSATWKVLVADGLPRGVDRDGPQLTPKDLGLKVASKSNVMAFLLCPTPSTVPDQHPDSDAWIHDGRWVVLEGSDKLIMHLDIQVMLVLARRSSAKPSPSFPCARATTPTEKAICGSFALAAWDRRVALAWHQLNEAGLRANEFEEQKTWLRSRDACLSDAACLERMMSQRVQDLNKR